MWLGGSAGCASWSASRAKAADDQFAFAKEAFAEGVGSRFWHVVPIHIFDVAAAVADEMVMAHAFGIEAGGAAFDGDFADQAGFDEVAQIVINGGPGRARVEAIDGFEDFGSGGMAGMLDEEGHNAVTLRRAAQAAALEGLLDCLGIHAD